MFLNQNNNKYTSLIHGLAIIALILLDKIICQDQTEPNIDILQCRMDQYQDNSLKCNSCEGDCGKCIEQKCLFCNYGQLNESKCLNQKQICPEEFVFNEEESSCVKCKTDFCKHCSSNNVCYECKNNFKLTETQTCKLKEDFNDQNNEIKVSCNVGEEQKQGFCFLKQACSSNYQNHNDQISKDTISLVELEDKNILILINKDSVQIYSYSSQNLQSEIFRIRETDEEKIQTGVKTQNYFVILTSKFLYQYDLKSFAFINKYTLNNNQQNIDSNIKYLYSESLSDKIYYLSFLQNQNQLRIVNIEISNYLNIISDQILFQENKLQVSSLAFLYEERIVIATNQKKTMIVNLAYLSETKSEINLIQTNFVIQFSQIIQVQISWRKDKERLFFYVLQQTDQKTTILKIEYDSQKDKVIQNSQQLIQWKNENKLSTFYKLYYRSNIQQINNKIFLKSLISYKFTEQVSQSAENFLGLAEVDFFFDNINDQYFYYEQMSIKLWKDSFTIYPYLYQPQKEKDKIMMIVIESGFIQLYEIQNRENSLPKEKMKKIIYDNKVFDGLCQFSNTDQSISIKIKSQIFKIILKEIEQNKVDFQQSTQNVDQMRDVYFSKESIYQVVVPQYLTNQNFIKYSFIILNKVSRYFEVIQTVQNYYGEITILAKSIFQFILRDEKFNTIEEDSFCSQEDQMLYVISKKGIYVIQFHTLKLIEFIPLQYYLLRNQNILMSITNNLQFDSDAQQFVNNFELILMKYESGKFGVLIKLETFSELNFSQDISQHSIKFNPIIPDMIFIKYQNNQQTVIDKVFIGNQEIQVGLKQGFIIQSLSFLSESQIGYLVYENTLTAYKITIETDDSGKWKISDSAEYIFDEYWTCQQIGIRKFSVCINIVDDYQKLSLFDWEKLKIVTNNPNKDENEPIEYLDNYSLFYYYLTFELAVISEESTKILIILREKEVDQNHQYSSFLTLYFDPNKEILYFKNQDKKPKWWYLDTQSKIKQIQNINIFSYSNPFHQNHNRILFGDPNILGGYIGIEDNYGYDSQTYWEQDNSFLYQDQGQVLMIKRLGQMKYLNNSISYKQGKVLTSNNLGLILIYSENSIDFVTLDTHDLKHRVKCNNNISPQNIFWSEKFSTLLILDQLNLKGYNVKDKFKQIAFEINFSGNFTGCLLFQKNPIFACNFIGFYNFEKKIFVQNKEVFVSLYRKITSDIPKWIENDEFILTTVFQPNVNRLSFTYLAVFNLTKNQFDENKILQYISNDLNFYIHPKVKNQIVCIVQSSQECSILSYQTLAQIKVFKKSICSYMEQMQSLIVRSTQSTAIYKLPLNPKSQPLYLYQNIFHFYGQIKSNSLWFYVEQIYNDKYYSQYYKVYNENLATGQIQAKIQFIIYNDNMAKSQLWEEKEMFFYQNTLLSYSDKRYVWMLSKKIESIEYIGDFNYRYNYIIKQYFYTDENYITQNTIESLDISEVFPFNSFQNDLYNNLKVKNFAYVFLNNDNYFKNLNSHVVTLNYQTQKVIKYYLTEKDKQEELFDLKDYYLNNSEDSEFSKDYKTMHKIIYLEDNDIQTQKFIFGINIQCKIIFFEMNQVQEIIDLKEYSCDIQLINSSVFLINQNKNTLVKLEYEQGKIIKKEILLKQQNDKIISYINTDIQCKWILIMLLDSQGNKVNESLLIRNKKDSSIEITIKNTSPTSASHFFDLNNQQYLLVGEEDSSITLYLLDYDTQESDQVLTLIDQKINVKKGIIFQFRELIVQDSTKNIQSIYVSSKFRVLYFKINVNKLNQISSLTLVNMQMKHTRSYSQLKILGNIYIAVLSSIQVTLYSLTLQYVCRVEENTFTSIDDIQLAQDNLTLILTDNQNIYGYNLINMNERERLILQQKFSFIYPIIHIMKQVNQTLMIYGTSIDKQIKIKYITTFKQGNIDCIRQLKNFNSLELQISQYDQILTENQNNPNQMIYLSQQLEQNSILLLPDTILLKNPNSKVDQFISLEIDLNNYQLELNDVQNIDNYQNALKLLKITNGTLIIKNPRIFQNMNSLIFKDITLTYEKGVEWQYKNINNFVFDNVKINGFNIEKQISDYYLYTLYNIQNIQFNKLNIQQSTFNSEGLIQVERSNSTKINSITLKNSRFKIKKPLIWFKDQNIKIDINVIRIEEGSELLQLFSFANTQNIQIYDLLIQKFTQYEYEINQIKRLLQNDSVELNEDIEENIQRESLISVKNTFSNFAISKVQIIDEKNSLNTLLFYSNEIMKNEMNYEDELQNYYTPLKSRLNITDFLIENIKFKTKLFYLKENTININKITLKNNKNCICEFYNSCSLTIQEFTLENNKITAFPLLKFDKSFIKITDLFVKQTNLTSEKQEERAFIELNECNFNINNLQGQSNSINGIFIYIKKNFKSDIDKNKEYLSLDKKAYIKGSKILNTQGSGMKVQDLESITIDDTEIDGNNSQENGGGIYMVNVVYSNLTNVNITNNKAECSGGGIYLENSDLQLNNCRIKNNKAQIGGGIKYNNRKIKPFFLKQLDLQVFSNTADLFGENYSSFPKYIKMEELNELTKDQLPKSIKELSNYKNAVSSTNQQITAIGFKLQDENNSTIKLPQKLQNNDLIKRNSNEKILNPKLIDELLKYYEFILESNDASQIIISNQNETCQYDYKLNLFYFLKYLTNQEKIKDSKTEFKPENKTIQMSIKSKYQFVYSFLNDDKSEEPQSLIQQFDLTFRPCKAGEIIQIDESGYYNCWKCSENTYSLEDPYILYNTNSSGCKDCPKNQECEGNNIKLTEGNWMKNGTDQVYPCYNTEFACKVGNDTKEGCIEGYFGPMCESCDYENKLWGRDNQTQQIIKRYAKKGKFKCTECNDAIALKNQIILSVVIGILFVVYLAQQITSNLESKILKLKAIYFKQCGLLYTQNSIDQNDKTSILVKIIINYLQLIGIVNSFSVNVPDLFKVAIAFGNVLDSTTYSVDCLFVNTGLANTIPVVYLRLMWTLFQPILIIALLSLLFFIMFKTRKQRNTRKRNLIISGLLKVYYMIFPAIVQQTIGNMSYRLVNGVYYIFNDIQFECYDSNYYFYNFLIGLPFLAFTVIFPYILYRQLKANSHHLNKNLNIFLSYGFFFTEFKTTYCYWEIIRIYQKILTYAIIGFFNEDNLISSIFMSIIIVLYINLQIKTQPFIYQEFNKIDIWSQLTAVITILSMIINTTSKNTFLVYLSLVAVFIANAYFIYRIIRCFLSNILPIKVLQKIQEIQEKLYKYNPKLFSQPVKMTVNIYQVTKNWKKVSKVISNKLIWSHQDFSTSLFLSKSPLKKMSQFAKLAQSKKMSIIPENDLKKSTTTMELENQENESMLDGINIVKQSQYNTNFISQNFVSSKNYFNSPKHNLDSPKIQGLLQTSDEKTEQIE